MIVSTAEGERATITLPDGSRVTLNTMSQLSYSIREFNQDKRHIVFDGEGYFQIYRNEKVPFLITTPHFEVEVLGTVFNFSVRDTEKLAELALEEGSVLLRSSYRKEGVMLCPNERALVNQETGEISVVREKNVKNASAWKRGELVFRNSKLQDVLRGIEEVYKISFRVDCEDCMANTFTGTLPTSDLNEVLAVLALSYDLHISICGK